MVLPWSGFWERNYFAQAWPALGPVITNHFLRGGITGLGVVNLLAGFVELAPIFATQQDHRPGGPAPRYDQRADSRAEP